MRKSAALLSLGLLALLLSGCEGKKDMIRMGMLNAPVAYVIAVATLYSIRQAFRWRCADSSLRTGVLAIPFGILILIDVMIFGSMGSTPKERDDVILGALLLSPFLFPFLAGALGAVILVLWRIWFALSPKESYEGAAMVGAALFFAPGVGALTGFIRITEQFVTNVSFLCMCLAGSFLPIALFLLLEAYTTKPAAPPTAPPPQLPPA